MNLEHIGDIRIAGDEKDCRPAPLKEIHNDDLLSTAAASITTPIPD
jgi:hypothetical protein